MPERHKAALMAALSHKRSGMGIEMTINILFVIVMAVLAAGAAQGWKRGLIEGLIRIVSGILGILVLAVLLKGIGDFADGRVANVVVAIVLLIIIGTIHKAVKILLGTFRLLRFIPVGKMADKLAGIVLGAAEAVFIIWLAFLLIGSFGLLELNSWLIKQVSQNKLLTTIYYSNYLVQLLKQVI